MCLWVSHTGQCLCGSAPPSTPHSCTHLPRSGFAQCTACRWALRCTFWSCWYWGWTWLWTDWWPAHKWNNARWLVSTQCCRNPSNRRYSYKTSITLASENLVKIILSCCLCPLLDFPDILCMVTDWVIKLCHHLNTAFCINLEYLCVTLRFVWLFWFFMFN